MPGATVRIALPFPLATEPVSQGDDAIKALAEALDTYLQPATTEMAAIAGFSGGGTAYRRGKMVTLQIAVTSTSARGPGESAVFAPAGMFPPELLYFVGVDTDGTLLPMSISATGNVNHFLSRATAKTTVASVTYAIV